MAQIRLYIATSLDNFIALPDGNIDWLVNFPTPEGEDYGYAQFLSSIGTVLMGYKTYDFVANMEGGYPYRDKQNFVFTRKKQLASTDYLQFVGEDIVSFVANLKQTASADIWLVGGAEINTLLLQHDLIDELIVTKMPLFIGEGIPLFLNHQKQVKMQLADIQQFPNGVVSLTYRFLKQG